MKSKPFVMTRLVGVKPVTAGDNLVDILINSLKKSHIRLKNGDVLVVTQKIVSKSEGRLVNLSTVKVTDEARLVAAEVEKRPELVQLILEESNEVLRKRPGTIIVETRSGFVCANAGIDHSNVKGDWGDPEDWVLLLPKDADASAERIRKGIEEVAGKKVGVLIIDSVGRAWRNGTIGMAIGLSGLPSLVDLRGVDDLYNYKLRVTVVAAADGLAAAASLMMGEAAEGTPVVHVRGFPYPSGDGSARQLVRSKSQDLFR